ncbi:YqgE/AlgH family protein [Paracoccus jiaweipingae]|uniref:YqgE/AlgH family protein n=1 Tax=unclassified Paracoccus (in: a-proteobacteria) TaxID=2688777 RepID=UPI0037BB5E53
MTESQHLTGRILIAMPGMSDPRFAQSLVLICAHSPEGAMGLIVNRPMPRLGFAELLDQLGIDHGPDLAAVPVQFGGPVEPGRGFVLHRDDPGDTDLPEGSSRVAPGLMLTVTRDVLAQMAQGDGPSPALLALGYAGWGAGQLETEFLANGWMSAPLDLSLIFDADHGAKWARALRGLGIDPAMLSSTAGRA